MYLNPISAPYRILALVLLVLACIGSGYVQGISRESDRRDAQDLVQQRADWDAFNRALASGNRRAQNVIAWQQKARIYYRNWQEKLNHESDSQLAQCQTTDGAGAQQDSVHAVVLSGTWVGLYNAAWLPEFAAAGDSAGVTAEVIAAGTTSTWLSAGVTPREVLGNVKVNASLCAEDRKRHDELIELLTEIGKQ